MGGVDGLAGAVSVTVSPDGNHVYGAGGNDNALAVFSRNSTTGALTYVTTTKDGVAGVEGIVGIRWVTVSPDGDHVYTAASSDHTITVFSRSTTTGALTFVTTSEDGVAGVDGLLAARSVTVSPDGKHVYGTGASDNAVAAFSRNTTTGALTFVTTSKNGVGGVDGLGPPSWRRSARTENTSTSRVTLAMQWRRSAGTRPPAPSPSWTSTRTASEASTGLTAPSRCPSALTGITCT